MFKGLTGLKKAVKGGINVVSEHTSQLAEQVVGDPSTSKSHLREALKQRVHDGVAGVVGAKENVLDEAEEHGISKEKVGKVAHDIKHYGQFGEEYLGYSDPTKDLRKAVKEREKAAKKARKAKKKKTGKKEDLFDPENLAKYKKEIEERKRREQEAEEAAAKSGREDEDEDEHRHHGEEKEGKEDEEEEELNLRLAAPVAAAAAAAVDSESDVASSAAHSPAEEAIPAKDSENWKLFQSLTSGVDNLIKKTQDELGEIKKESYFQQKQAKTVDKTREAQEERKLKKKKKKKWVDLDSGGFEDFDGDVQGLEERRKRDSAEEDSEEDEEEEEEEPKEEKDLEKEEEPHEDKEEEGDKSKPIVFKEPSIEEIFDPDADDDLFNTNFVDVITSGDVKLAVIPDDPVIEEGDDDPFNTAIADVVVKKQEEIKRKEATKLKFTGLSSVADVLAGKSDKVDKSLVEVTVKRKRRRANRINLIGEDGTEITNLEDISKAVVDTGKQTDQEDILTKGEEALAVPEGNLLASTPSPCLVSPASKEETTESGSKSGLDVSEFDPEFVSPADQGFDLTSNVAILSGEFVKPAEEEADEFDAAFDALAQESVTKAKLDELEKEFENDDIFDTSKADKVLQLASLLDKVEESDKEEEDEDEEKVEINFDDPFDTSAYDHIAIEAEEELAFESLAKRDPSAEAAGEASNPDPSSSSVAPIDDAGASAFSTPAVRVNNEEDWAAFADDGTAIKKKPSRPPPPKPAPKRPPPPGQQQPYTLSEEDAPPVVVKAPSTDSLKSWNCAVADNLIKKSKLESENEALEEEEEEFDPFDTTQFADSGVTNFEDPFDTSAVEGIVASDDKEEEEEEKREEQLEPEEEEYDSNEEEEVPDPFDVLNVIDPQGDQIKSVPVIAPVSKEEAAEDADPFDTAFAADVLPNRGDPFDTSYVKGDPGKAELRALEEELLGGPEEAKNVSKEVPGIAGRARPKGSTGTPLSVKVPEVGEEEEEDPFDTTLAEKVIAGESLEPEPEEKEEEAPPPPKVPEEDEFDPSKSFARSISVRSEKEKLAQEEEERKKREAEEQAQLALPPGQLRRPPSKRDVSPKKEDSIDSDDFDPRA